MQQQTAALGAGSRSACLGFGRRCAQRSLESYYHPLVSPNMKLNRIKNEL